MSDEDLILQLQEALTAVVLKSANGAAVLTPKDVAAANDKILSIEPDTVGNWIVSVREPKEQKEGS